MELPAPGQWRFRTFAGMLQARDGAEDGRPLLIGADHNGPLEVSLADLRGAAAAAERWRQAHGYSPGDSLLLLRLPLTSEVPLAAASIALMARGRRVVLPMSFDRASLTAMAQTARCRAMLWCGAEVAATANPQVLAADAMYRSVAAELGLQTYSLDELRWHRSPAAVDTPGTGDEASAQPPDDREVLVLSTSGSTGQPKLVRYTERALLAVAESWNAAGLMAEELTGGRSICPALSHSMGFRNVLNAIWNRQPTLLVQPEWLEEQPKKFVKLLERCPPQHITCGPALLGDLCLLAASVTRVRDALCSLKCVVSSGAADVAIQRALPPGVRAANAFGMTEVQQALNTLLSSHTSVRGALGSPLPGVSVGVQYVNPALRLGRLFVRAPFMARGYVGAPDFGPWFETGDLVRVEGDDLVWVGRTTEDYLNTGLGAKVSLAELRAAYEQLQRASEAVLFVALPSRAGVGALVYVGQRDPADEAVQRSVLDAISADHRQLAERQSDFALNYMAVVVVGCVAGRPPRRGPGKIDRAGALTAQQDLLAAMDSPGMDRPQVIDVPRYGSDRPDWRRFALG